MSKESEPVIDKETNTEDSWKNSVTSRLINSDDDFFKFQLDKYRKIQTRLYNAN